MGKFIPEDGNWRARTRVSAGGRKKIRPWRVVLAWEMIGQSLLPVVFSQSKGATISLLPPFDLKNGLFIDPEIEDVEETHDQG